MGITSFKFHDQIKSIGNVKLELAIGVVIATGGVSTSRVCSSNGESMISSNSYFPYYY